MFKLYFVFLSSLLLFVNVAMAATCTSTTRNNYSTNQVLTSSALNNDFNQLVTKVNAFDGGCVTAGSLEFDALNTTQFAPILKAIKEGCKVSYSSATTISIGKCFAAVNGAYVSTTIATTASFGCTSCSAEVASTTYYVYIATGSSGTTLTPLISTTAPNEDGYDNSGNKVLARFYNNASSDIDQYSIDQWHVNSFIPQGTGWVSFTPVANGFGTISNTYGRWRRVGSSMEIMFHYASGTPTAVSATVNMPTGFTIDSSVLGTKGHAILGNLIRSNGVDTYFYNTDGHGFVMIYDGTNADRIAMSSRSVTDNELKIDNASVLFSSGDGLHGELTVPVAGWND